MTLRMNQLLNRILYAIIVNFLFFSNATTWSQTNSNIAKLFYYVGDVKIQREGATLNPGINLLLKKGDVIKTAKESVAEVQFRNDNRIRIEELTTFTIQGFQIINNTEETKVKIKVGEIVGNFKKLVKGKQTFLLETPTATAAIHGTQIMMTVDNSGATQLGVLEGAVSMTLAGSREEAKVSTGQIASANPGQTKITPQPMPAEMKQNLSAKVEKLAVTVVKTAPEEKKEPKKEEKKELKKEEKKEEKKSENKSETKEEKKETASTGSTGSTGTATTSSSAPAGGSTEPDKTPTEGGNPGAGTGAETPAETSPAEEPSNEETVFEDPLTGGGDALDIPENSELPPELLQEIVPSSSKPKR